MMRRKRHVEVNALLSPLFHLHLALKNKTTECYAALSMTTTKTASKIEPKVPIISSFFLSIFRETNRHEKSANVWTNKRTKNRQIPRNRKKVTLIAFQHAATTISNDTDLQLNGNWMREREKDKEEISQFFLTCFSSLFTANIRRCGMFRIWIEENGSSFRHAQVYIYRWLL